MTCDDAMCKMYQKDSVIECAYCGMLLPRSEPTYYTGIAKLEDLAATTKLMKCISFKSRTESANFTEETSIIIEYTVCTRCKQIGIIISYPNEEKRIYLKPYGGAMILPDYIPEQIRQDYQEACAVAAISPRASVVLGRRCLQGMLRDKFNITAKGDNLVNEIAAAKEKKYISEDEAQLLTSIRYAGNLGAHPTLDLDQEVNVTDEEIQDLLQVMRMFLDKWYIQAYEQSGREARLNAFGEYANALLRKYKTVET